MLKQIVLGVTAIAATFTAMPSAADAHPSRYQHQHQSYYDGYDRGYSNNDYYDGRGYARGYDRRGYDGNGYYGRGGYSRQRSYGGYNDGRYYGNRGYSDNRYYGNRGYYDDRGYGRRRCGSGTTGAIVGGAGGALVGRSIARGGRNYYGYRRGGNGTVGALIGGAAGALIGREIDRSC